MKSKRAAAECRRKTSLASRRGARAAATAIALLMAGSAAAQSQLEGIWESIERTDGGVGMTYEFRPDGVACISPGAMVDLVYRFSQNRVAVLAADLSEEPETVMAFRLEGEHLVADLGSDVPSLERIAGGDDGQGPVVGVWKYIDAGQGQAGGQEAEIVRRNTRIRFTPDGRTLLRIPFRIDCGAYEVDGDTLIMERSGKRITPAFRIDGDTLTLTSKAGDTSSFKRLID